MLLLFSICVDCASNPTVTLSTLTQTEVSLIEDTCKDINELIYENSRDTGITDPKYTDAQGFERHKFSEYEWQMIENVEFNVSIIIDWNSLKTGGNGNYLDWYR